MQKCEKKSKKKKKKGRMIRTTTNVALFNKKSFTI